MISLLLRNRRSSIFWSPVARYYCRPTPGDASGTGDHESKTAPAMTNQSSSSKADKGMTCDAKAKGRFVKACRLPAVFHAPCGKVVRHYAIDYSLRGAAQTCFADHHKDLSRLDGRC